MPETLAASSAGNDALSKPPHVSVGVPVYNDVKFIGRALQGLADQNYHDFEVIISDNCSTDGTSEICRAFAEKYAFMRYVRQPENIGPSPNFKFVLEAARGMYFAWAASDDFWRPDYLKCLAGALDAHPRAATAFGGFVTIDNKGDILKEFNFDFGGRTAFIRIAKFLLTRSRRKDVLIYGLHRIEPIREAKFYSWWGINANRVLRGAYPICTHLLACGYCHVSEVLFESRADPDEPRAHYARTGGLRERLALNLLEINVHVAMLDAASRALRSFAIVPLLVPVSIVSFFITTGREDAYRLKEFLVHSFKRFAGGGSRRSAS